MTVFCTSLRSSDSLDVWTLHNSVIKKKKHECEESEAKGCLFGKVGTRVFSVKKKSRCQCVQEDWDSGSDCCMFGVWMFHRRYADRLLEVCASDVSVLHVMGFDRRDMASARLDAFFFVQIRCVCVLEVFLVVRCAEGIRFSCFFG